MRKLLIRGLLGLPFHLLETMGLRYIYIYIFIYICIFIFIYRYIYSFIYIYIYIHLYIYIYMHLYMYIYIHLYIYLHIYVYIYIFTYIQDCQKIRILWWSSLFSVMQLKKQMSCILDSLQINWNIASLLFF